MSNGKDSRRDPRAKVLSMTVRYKSATVAEFVENHSHDVSRGGLFIKTPSPFPAGTLIKFEVKIADEQSVMMGVGRVAWKREADLGDERPAGMGVKFIKIGDDSVALIDRLIAERDSEEASFEFGAREAGVAISAPPSSLRGRSSVSPVSRPSAPIHRRPAPVRASEPAPELGRETSDSDRATFPGKVAGAGPISAGSKALRPSDTSAFHAAFESQPSSPTSTTETQEAPAQQHATEPVAPPDLAERELAAAESEATPTLAERELAATDTPTPKAPRATEEEGAPPTSERASDSTRPSQRPKAISRKRNRKPKKKRRKFKSSISVPPKAASPRPTADADSTPPITEQTTTPPKRQRPAESTKSRGLAPWLLSAAIVLGIGLLWMNKRDRASSSPASEPRLEKKLGAAETPAREARPAVAEADTLEATQLEPSTTEQAVEPESATPPSTAPTTTADIEEGETATADETSEEFKRKAKRKAMRRWREWQRSQRLKAKAKGTAPTASANAATTPAPSGPQNPLPGSGLKNSPTATPNAVVSQGPAKPEVPPTAPRTPAPPEAPAAPSSPARPQAPATPDAPETPLPKRPDQPPQAQPPSPSQPVAPTPPATG